MVNTYARLVKTQMRVLGEAKEQCPDNSVDGYSVKRKETKNKTRLKMEQPRREQKTIITFNQNLFQQNMLTRPPYARAV